MSKLLVDLVKNAILNGDITEDVITAARALKITDPDEYIGNEAIKMVAGMEKRPSKDDAEYARRELLAESFEQAKKGVNKNGSVSGSTS